MKLSLIQPVEDESETLPKRKEVAMKLAIVAAFMMLYAASASAQTLAVKIVDRQDNETEYTYIVPARFHSNSDTDVNCSGDDSYANCHGSTVSNGTGTPAHEVSYHVQGATFSLQLPDGRIAVVNCESKFAEHFAGRAGNHRSCRMPLVDDIRATFRGDKAKLEWVVSIDGKKTQSETYKVLGVLDAPKRSQN